MLGYALMASVRKKTYKMEMLVKETMKSRTNKQSRIHWIVIVKETST